MVVRNILQSQEVAVTEEADSTTPFCISCGQWVFDFDELQATPFVYCVFCDLTTKKKKRITKSKKDRL